MKLMLSFTYLDGETTESCVARYAEKYLSGNPNRHLVAEQFREFVDSGMAEHDAAWETLLIWGILDDDEQIIARWNKAFGADRTHTYGDPE